MSTYYGWGPPSAKDFRECDPMHAGVWKVVTKTPLQQFVEEVNMTDEELEKVEADRDLVDRYAKYEFMDEYPSITNCLG